jgi:hypothetical protein
MMLTIKQKISKNYINAIGWSTKRKLFLIESDDWGSIRMPSRQVYNKLLENKVQVDKSYFDKNDSLESVADLQNLFEVLSSVKDINDNPASITAFSVVANPDFEKIRENGRYEYVYEPIKQTYKRKNHTNGSVDIFKEGANDRLLYPQFHGREHLHPQRWIAAINSNSRKERLAFDYHAFIGSRKSDDVFHFPIGYMAAFNWTNVDEIENQKKVIIDGLSLFKQIFGFESVSFVASQSIYSNDINKTLLENGVNLISGQQYCPQGNGTTKIINKAWGKKNSFGQVYWRRNCQFEPARNQDKDWVKSCLAEIEIAFRWGKPAVINSHRVNYIGSIFPENRDQSLRKLLILLKEVKKNWPDVEFIDTERLANIMLQTIN